MSFALLVLVAAVTNADAALPPEAPTPGQVQDTLPSPTPVLPTEAPIIEPPQAAPPPRTGSDRTFVIRRFEIVGNTVLAEEELFAALTPYTGRPVTLDEVFDAADVLTKLYRERGYGLATVTVPAQKLDAGTLRLEVIEGVIAKIAIEGNARYASETIQAFASDLEPGSVYRADVMERTVLTLNDLPGLRARAVVTPGADFGTSDILFKVTEIPMEFSATMDNYGREAIGTSRLLFNAGVNSLGLDGDQLAFSFVHAQGDLLNYANLGYSFPLGHRGQRFGISYNRADYLVDPDLFQTPGQPFSPFGIEGTTQNLRLDYAHPIVRTRRANLVFIGALMRNETETDTGAPGAIVTTDASLDLFEVGVFMNRVFANGASGMLSIAYSGNFQQNESTPTALDGENQLAKIRIDGSYNQPLTPPWVFVSRLAAAWSPETLPDTQKFSLGGPQSIRGFQPSEARGDLGLALTASLRRYDRAFGVPYYASFFLDGGFVSRHLLDGESPDTPHSARLASVGVGVTINPDGRYSGQIQAAQPVGGYQPTDGDDGARLWATFSVKF
ncbi:MAG TPA: ShlB/FhaC/HecB family hemolysin secretion/activation protein [Gammaproteobacteria bacterium]|nr:ShlB/FhaC/HecB family hemolysin secretion/activation protein [Gammaproteobacteria bacterium]